MKKFLFTAAFISACLIFFSGSANAKLLLCDIDKNGYKTYIDTDSVSSRTDKEKGIVGISVRVVGIRPDGSKILDAVEQYIYDKSTNKLYMSNPTHNIDWQEIDPKTQGKHFWWTVEYILTGTVSSKSERGKSNSSGSSSGSSIPEKVYVGMNDYGDKEVYILPRTIRNITFKGYNGFSVQAWFSNGTSPRNPWYFVYKDGQWCQTLSLDDMSYPVPISKSKILVKVVEVANRYR